MEFHLFTFVVSNSCTYTHTAKIDHSKTVLLFINLKNVILDRVLLFINVVKIRYGIIQLFCIITLLTRHHIDADTAPRDHERRWVTNRPRISEVVYFNEPHAIARFQPVIHACLTKRRGMCCPVCGMVHVNDQLLIGKSSLSSGCNGLPFSLS